MKWLALLALSGCDYLLGLTHLGPAVVPNTGTVTGTYSWFVVSATGDGTPHLDRVTPSMDAVDLRAQLEDGTNLPVTKTPGGFTFTLPPGAPYIFKLQPIDAAVATEIQSVSATIDLATYITDRADAVGATTDFIIAYHVPFQTMTGDFEDLVSTGARSQTSFDAGTASDPMLTSWRLAVTAQGTHGPLLSSQQFHDRLVFEHWTSAPGYQQLDAADVETVEMSDGPAPLNLAPTVPAVTLDRCAHVVAPRATELARLAMYGSGDPSAGWSVSSVVSVATPPSYMLQLVANATVANSDEALDVHYGSPFAGEVDVMAFGANVTKSLTVPGAAMPASLGYGTIYYIPVPATGTCPALAIDPLPMYIGGALGGTSLDGDLQTVMIDRSGLVPFTLRLSDGAYTDVPLILDEVVDDNGTTTLRALRGYEVGDSLGMLIDPTLLVHGHYYTINYIIRRGFPDALALDFTHYEYPTGDMTGYTPMFQIGN